MIKRLISLLKNQSLIVSHDQTGEICASRGVSGPASPGRHPHPLSRPTQATPAPKIAARTHTSMPLLSLIPDFGSGFFLGGFGFLAVFALWQHGFRAGYRDFGSFVALIEQFGGICGV